MQLLLTLTFYICPRSGGYEDDEDGGDVIIYTGQGGQDKNSRQCGNQKLEGGNLALERSMHYGLEVRVILGEDMRGAPVAKFMFMMGCTRLLRHGLMWVNLGLGCTSINLLEWMINLKWVVQF